MALELFIGHNQQKSFLENAAHKGEPANTYIFHGPDNIGKKLVAKWFALHLNCAQIPSPCGDCFSCTAIQNGNHPDLIEVKPDGKQIKIDQSRALQEKLKYMNRVGKYRVVIINEAEKLFVHAANSLLKILEEPPNQTIFILITNQLGKILPTIRSRSVKLKFNQLSNDETQQVLIEKLGVSQQTATMAAAILNGKISLPDIETLESLPQLKSDIKNILNSLLNLRNDFSKAIEITDDLLKDEETLKIKLAILTKVLYKTVENRNTSRELLKGTVDNLYLIEKTYDNLGTNINPRLLLISLFFNMYKNWSRI